VKHTVVEKQNNSRLCFVCGINNEFGLKASFYEIENEELVAIFSPGNFIKDIPVGCTEELHPPFLMKLSEERY